MVDLIVVVPAAAADADDRAETRAEGSSSELYRADHPTLEGVAIGEVVHQELELVLAETREMQAVQRRVDDPIASRELSTLYMRYWTETEPYIWKSLRTFGKRNGLFDCEDGAAA